MEKLPLWNFSRSWPNKEQRNVWTFEYEVESAYNWNERQRGKCTLLGVRA